MFNIPIYDEDQLEYYIKKGSPIIVTHINDKPLGMGM